MSGQPPGSGFPAPTADRSREAWPGGEQPTNLQCWPRHQDGFPQRCQFQQARVLEDTADGWPGRCDGMKKILDLEPGETCQMRCFMSALCGVWMEKNDTNTGMLTCWQALHGTNCYEGTEHRPVWGQRVMHGDVHVLIDTMGAKIMNLTKAFDAFPKSKGGADEGARHCKNSCMSYLFCQYWQYSDEDGCWVEDPAAQEVPYPLVSDNISLVQGTKDAHATRGEFIQHVCEPGPVVPLPTDAPGARPRGTILGGSSRQPSTPLGDGSSRQPPTSLGDLGEGQDESEGQSGGGSSGSWKVFIIIMLLMCCLAGLAGVALMKCSKRTKRKNWKSGSARKQFSRASKEDGIATTAAKQDGGKYAAHQAGDQIRKSTERQLETGIRKYAEEQQPLVNNYVSGDSHRPMQQTLEPSTQHQQQLHTMQQQTPRPMQQQLGQSNNGLYGQTPQPMQQQLGQSNNGLYGVPSNGSFVSQASSTSFIQANQRDYLMMMQRDGQGLM